MVSMLVFVCVFDRAICRHPDMPRLRAGGSPGRRCGTLCHMFLHAGTVAGSTVEDPSRMDSDSYINWTALSKKSSYLEGMCPGKTRSPRIPIAMNTGPLTYAPRSPNGLTSSNISPKRRKEIFCKARSPVRQRTRVPTFAKLRWESTWVC